MAECLGEVSYEFAGARIDFFSKENEIVGATAQVLEDFALPIELPGQGKVVR